MRYMSQNLNLIDRFLIYHILNSTAECRLNKYFNGIDLLERTRYACSSKLLIKLRMLLQLFSQQLLDTDVI